jgi:hypothetical protein
MKKLSKLEKDQIKAFKKKDLVDRLLEVQAIYNNVGGDVHDQILVQCVGVLEPMEKELVAAAKKARGKTKALLQRNLSVTRLAIEYMGSKVVNPNNLLDPFMRAQLGFSPIEKLVALGHDEWRSPTLGLPKPDRARVDAMLTDANRLLAIAHDKELATKK